MVVLQLLAVMVDAQRLGAVLCDDSDLFTPRSLYTAQSAAAVLPAGKLGLRCARAQAQSVTSLRRTYSRGGESRRPLNGRDFDLIGELAVSRSAPEKSWAGNETFITGLSSDDIDDAGPTHGSGPDSPVPQWDDYGPAETERYDRLTCGLRALTTQAAACGTSECGRKQAVRGAASGLAAALLAEARTAAARVQERPRVGSRWHGRGRESAGGRRGLVGPFGYGVAAGAAS